MSLNSATSTYGETEIHPVTRFWSVVTDLGAKPRSSPTRRARHVSTNDSG